MRSRKVQSRWIYVRFYSELNIFSNAYEPETTETDLNRRFCLLTTENDDMYVIISDLLLRFPPEWFVRELATGAYPDKKCTPSATEKR